MGSLNLRDVQRDDSGRIVDRGATHITSQDSRGHATFHKPPEAPVHISRRIWDAVLKANGAVTRQQIAKALGVKKTPWLVTAIEQLVQDGYLNRQHGAWKNGCVMYYYTLPESE